MPAELPTACTCSLLLAVTRCVYTSYIIPVYIYICVNIIIYIYIYHGPPKWQKQWTLYCLWSLFYDIELLFWAPLEVQVYIYMGERVQRVAS